MIEPVTRNFQLSPFFLVWLFRFYISIMVCLRWKYFTLVQAVIPLRKTLENFLLANKITSTNGIFNFFGVSWMFCRLCKNQRTEDQRPFHRLKTIIYHLGGRSRTDFYAKMRNWTQTFVKINSIFWNFWTMRTPT